MYIQMYVQMCKCVYAIYICIEVYIYIYMCKHCMFICNYNSDGQCYTFNTNILIVACMFSYKVDMSVSCFVIALKYCDSSRKRVILNKKVAKDGNKGAKFRLTSKFRTQFPRRNTSARARTRIEIAFHSVFGTTEDK